MVGYVWKNRACVRTYRKSINYPNTEGQRRERDWFVGMVRFASQAKSALQMGFRIRAAELGMTEGNYFISRNKAHFRRVDGGVETEYGRLTIAEGPASDVLFRSPEFREGEVVSIEFEKNMLFSRSSGDDRVFVYAYAPDLAEGFLAAPALRRSKHISVQLPESWAGMEVHLYGFVVDREGRSSNSTYIGVGKVDYCRERGVYIPVNKGWDEFVEMASRANEEQPQNSPNLPKNDHIDIFGVGFKSPPD